MESSLMLILLFTVATVCGLPDNHLMTRRSFLPSNSPHLGMFDGNKTTIEQHPYQGAIIQRGFDQVFCAVTIIGKEWALALGDCVSGQSNETIYLIFGTTNGQKGIKVEVAEIVTHPNYGQSTCNYDVGVIKFKKPVTFSDKVKPARLPKACNLTKTELNVAGWGEQSAENTDWVMKEGNMDQLTPKSCIKYYQGFGLKWSKNMGCIYNKGKTTLCQGDWGDLAVNKVKQNGTTQYVGQHMFCAIATSGICSPDAYPAITSRVCAHVKWIEKVTGIKSYEEM